MRFTYYNDDGRKRAALEISGALQWPAIIVNTSANSFEVTTEWNSWVDRFPNGFDTDTHLFDGTGVPFTLKRAANDGHNVPVLVTERTSSPMAYNDLVARYLCWCQTNDRVAGDLSRVADLRAFVAIVLDDFGLTI